MLGAFLNRITGASRGAPVTTTGQPLEQPQDTRQVLAYPPPKDVWPRYEPEKLLEPHEELIGNIRHSIAMPKDQFNELFRPVLVRFAAYVHLLPASESHHHCGPGGLLHHSIEVASFSAHFAESMVFGVNYEPVVRKKVEARSRVAGALAGLFHDAGKPLGDVAVQSTNGELRWNPHAQSIYDFLVANGLDHYDIVFRPNRHKRHETRAGTVIERLMGPQMNAYLCIPETNHIQDDLYDAVADPRTPNNPFASLILQADTASVSLDMKRQRSQIGGSTKSGLGLAMRYLMPIQAALRDGTMTANQPGGLVWVTEAAVFLRHPDAIKYAVAQLSAEGQGGFPTQTGDIIDILIDNNLVQGYAMPSGGTRTAWEIEVKIQGAQAITQTMNALRVDRHDYIFGNAPLPDAVPVRVIPPATTAVVPFPGANRAAADSEPQITAGTSVEDTIAEKHRFVESGGAGSAGRELTVTEAEQWVEQNIRAGQYLMVIAKGFASGDPEFKASVIDLGDRVAINHARAFKTITQAGQVLGVLAKAKCLVPSKDNDNVFVTQLQIPGKESMAGFITFTEHASAIIRSLIVKAMQEIAPEQAPEPAKPDASAQQSSVAAAPAMVQTPAQTVQPPHEPAAKPPKEPVSAAQPPAKPAVKQPPVPSAPAIAIPKGPDVVVSTRAPVNHEAKPVPVAAQTPADSLKAADWLFIKHRVYKNLLQRFPNIKGGLPALREMPLLSVIHPLASILKADPTKWVNALTAEPAPLLERVTVSQKPTLRVVENFAGATAAEPEGFYERNPNCRSLP